MEYTVLNSDNAVFTSSSNDSLSLYEAVKLHKQSLEMIEKSRNRKINHVEREFIYENYHEGAENMNSLISAHFTPQSIAVSMSHNIRCKHWVDLCAGIGILSNKLVRQNEFESRTDYVGICVENNEEYYNLGKKLLPECIWILGSIFDQEVIDEIKMIMSWHGEPLNFSVISNPPYGKQVKGRHELMKYTGNNFEYKAMEIGAMLGAYDGAFLIPQQSAPFRITGSRGEVESDKYITDEYMRFSTQTDLEIVPNIGFTTEIAIVEYSELHYIKNDKKQLNQQSLF